MTHEIRCIGSEFQAIWDGRCHFTVISDEHPVRPYDRVLLREYNLLREGYTGREVTRLVTYLQGISENCIALQLDPHGWCG